jgi:hypothetical protein
VVFHGFIMKPWYWTILSYVCAWVSVQPGI